MNRCRRITEEMWRRMRLLYKVQLKPKGGEKMTSDCIRVGDILQGNKTKSNFVVTFVGLKDVVVRGETGNKKKYRHAAFKGFTNLSGKLRKVYAKADLG